MKVLIRCTRPSLCRKEFLNMKMISIQVKPYSCPHCAKAFARQSALQKHIMDHALENDCNYKDPIIDKIIRKDVHRNTHVEEKHWHCLDCGKSFTCKHSLQRHMDIHTGQGSYPCIVCNKRLTQKSHLQRHMLTHTGEKPYSCTLCSVSYRQNGDLRTHMRTHTGEMPYICSWCGRGFMRGDVLRKHIRIHTKEKSFACLQCNRVFMRQDVLRTHMRIHTGEKPYSCTLCGQSYGQSGDLQIHMRTHTGEMPYTCSWCGRGFTRGDGLSKHVRIHTKEKPFACLQCNRVFMRQDVLRKHMRIHTGEKPYLCYKCGKMYMYLCALDSHMRNHIEEKAYSCTQCDKTFTHPCSLKIHLRTHTGEKFYSRSKDNTAFKQLDHSQTHAGQICYSCLRCGKSFTQRSSLRRHTKAHPREKTSCPNGSTSTHIDRFAQSMLYVAVKDEPDCSTYEQLTFPSTSASMTSMIDYMSVKQEQTEGQLNYERLSSSESQSNVHDGFMKQEPNDDMICDPLYRGTVQDICVEHNSSGDTFSCMYEPPIVNIVQAFSRTQVKHEVDGATATQDMSGVCVKVEPTVDVHRNEQVTPTVSSQGSTSTHIDRFAQSMLYVAVKDEPDCSTYEQLTFPSTSASMTSMIDYMSVKQEQTEGQLNYERLSSSESQSNVHDGFMKQEPNDDMICDPLYRGTVQDICVEHNSSGDTFSCMYEPPIVNIVQAFSRTQVKHEVDGATATQDMSGVCVKVEPTVDVHRNEQVTPTVSSQGSTSTHIDRFAQSMLYVAVKDEPDCGTYEQLTFPSTSASMISMIDYMSVKQEQTEGQLNYERLSSSESQSNVHDGFMKQEPNDDMICDPLYRGTVQDICVEHNSSGDTFSCMYEPPIVNIVQAFSRTQVKHEVDGATATQDMSGVCVKVEPTVDVHRNEQVTPTVSSQGSTSTHIDRFAQSMLYVAVKDEPDCGTYEQLTFPSTSASMISMIDYMSVKQEQTEGQLNYERLSSSESQSNVHDGFMKQEPNDDMICDPLYRGTVQDICVEHNSSGDTFSCMYEPPIVNIVQAFSRTQVKHEVDGATATQDMSGVCVKVEPTVDVHRNEQVTPTVSSQGSTSTHIDRFAQSMLYVAVKDEPDCGTYEQLTFPSTSASMTSMIDYMSVKQEQTEGQLNYERLSSSESQSNVHDGFMKQEPNDDMICDPLYRGTVQDICVEHNSSGDTFSCMYEPPIVNIVQAFSRTQVKHEVDGATATQDMSGVCVKVEPTVDVHRNEQVTPTVSSQATPVTGRTLILRKLPLTVKDIKPTCTEFRKLMCAISKGNRTVQILPPQSIAKQDLNA